MHVTYRMHLSLNNFPCVGPARIAQECPAVTYERITGTPFAIDESFNTVFLVLPRIDLQGQELDELSAFVQSGRQRRLVLVGEYSQVPIGFASYNAALNDVAEHLGIGTRFMTTASVTYDNGLDHNRLCAVNASHYLMGGVIGLWDAATDPFADGWASYAEPLAYTHDDPTPQDPNDPNPPWAVEEDTATAGSRILIHDASIVTEQYGYDDDTVPDKNFQFLHNLCAIFPE